MATADTRPGGRSPRPKRRSVWVVLAVSLASGLVALGVTNFSRSCGSETVLPPWGWVPLLAAWFLAVAAGAIAFVIRAIPEVVLGVALIAGCFALYFVWAALGLADPCQSGAMAAFW